MNKQHPVIGVTMGDPVGIGPEIIASALENFNFSQICLPVVLGDTGMMTRAIELTGTNLEIREIKRPDQALDTPGIINLICRSHLSVKDLTPGHPTTATGRAMIDYIDTAVEMATLGSIDAMATCPITKTAMKLAGSAFHGHTELIAHATHTENYAMMLAGDTLKVVLVTIHEPLSRVSQLLNIDNILKTIRITAHALEHRFGINHPAVAVAGLNPHAGEDSLFGPEERDLITPAVAQARDEGINATGPHPPDTLFFHASKGKYDGVVCMYHDQGLIPFKMIHFHDGVNTTLGLPIIRTSVDHGTAYDIAWQGKANHESLVQAIKMAALQAKMCRPT
ncbi:4-hydroxythreonine-4-phosphate dehydrogenase PdxA [Desulfocicer niacini]